MIVHANYFDSNKAMPFKVSDTKLLKKYIKIWGKIAFRCTKNLIVSLFMVTVTNT